MAPAAGCDRSADRSEPVVHVLPHVLRAVRCRLCRVGDVASPCLEAAPCVAPTVGGGSRLGRGYGAASAAVCDGAGPTGNRTESRRTVDVCGRCLLVCHRYT